MRKLIFILVTLVIPVIWVVSFFLGRGAQAVNVKLHVRDLPEHGIKIITPADPSFDGLMTAFQKKNPDAPIEALKLFSIFIKHSGNRPIVSYKLRWACMKSDGTVIYKESSYLANWILMDEGAFSHTSAIANAPKVIKPHSTWFFSQIAEPEPLEGGTENRQQSRSWHLTVSSDSGVIEQNPSEARVLSLLNAELSRYTSITISLDGVFFDDGSFAGPNETGFFEAVKAEVDARHDLLVDIQKGIQQGKSADEIIRSLEVLEAAPEVDIGLNSTPSDYYKYNKKRFAEKFLNIARHLGNTEAVQLLVKKLDRPWASLRRS